MNDSDSYLVKTFEIFEISKVEKSYEHLETAEKNKISEENPKFLQIDNKKTLLYKIMSAADWETLRNIASCLRRCPHVCGAVYNIKSCLPPTGRH